MPNRDGPGNYIRRHYAVPAKQHMRVIADGRPGVITGFKGQMVRVRHDGEVRSELHHPLEIEYLE